MIGVLDSGVGGLSVLRPLRRLLPHEDVTYVADAAWCPYGPKPAAVVRRRVFEIAGRLVARRAGLIVVACNTACAVALAPLRRCYPWPPFVGMEPAVKPAALQTKTGAIGVLATATTARGEPLARLVERFGRGIGVHIAVPHGLVELIEAGQAATPAAEAVLRPIVEEWRGRQVDVIVLGCTHYPFVRATLERLAGPSVAIVDPAPAVARHAARLLGHPSDIAASRPSGRTLFLTSGEPAALRRAVEALVPEPWARQAHFAPLGAL